jgi:WD40 repeat protein
MKIKLNIPNGKIICIALFFAMTPFYCYSQVNEVRHFKFDETITDFGSHLYQWIFSTEEGTMQTLNQFGVGNTPKISAISFHPAGSYFVTSNGKNFNIEFWSFIQANKQLKIYKGHTDKINSLLFSSDANYLLSCSNDSTVKIWDLKSDKLLNNIKTKKTINVVAISDNSNFIAYDNDNEIVIRSFNGDKQIAILKGHFKGINSLKFSPDGNFLASGSSDSTIILWNTRTWKIKKILKGQNDEISALDFHISSKYLASGGKNGSLVIWNIKKNQIIQTINTHKSAINRVNFIFDFDKQESLLLTCDDY